MYEWKKNSQLSIYISVYDVRKEFSTLNLGSGIKQI